jgi:hypothetical protein
MSYGKYHSANPAHDKGCRISPNVFTLTSELEVFVNALNDMATKVHLSQTR